MIFDGNAGNGGIIDMAVSPDKQIGRGYQLTGVFSNAYLKERR